MKDGEAITPDRAVLTAVGAALALKAAALVVEPHQCCNRAVSELAMVRPYTSTSRSAFP